MKLYLNAASPYARLVRVILVETGLQAQTELHYVDPWESPPDLLARNPAAKVPALDLDDGTQLIESGYICDYLIRHSDREDLSPASATNAADRLQVLGLGRVAIDCAFGAVLLDRFCQPSELAARWLNALPRIASSLEPLISRAAPRPSVDLADLTVAVAFEYVDFRLPDVHWRTRSRQLVDRVAELGKRQSLSTTHPQ